MPIRDEFKKQKSLNLSLHRIIKVKFGLVVIIAALIGILSTSQSAFATLEKDQERLENEIISLFRDKAGASHKHPITFQYSESIPIDQRMELLRKLALTLNKITYFNQLPRLTNILITNDRKESSYDYYDYFHGDMSLSLTTKDKNHPWVSLLSWDPLHEDVNAFIDDQSILRVDILRYFPPTPSESNPEVIETSRLPFKPYSSSYLSLRKGDILKRPPENRTVSVFKENKFNSTFNKEINQKYDSRSPIERFDHIRQNKLGSPTSLLTREFLKKIHNPNAEYWEGHCNQWSAGALDPEVNQFISKTKGVICDSVFISEGELKELFTLFYSDYVPKFVAGNRTITNFNEDSMLLRSHLGLDDLSAQEFHSNVHRYLKRAKGIVIEVSANNEVWNQPLYRATSRNVNASHNPAILSKISPLIPANLFESTEIKDQGILEEYQRIESDLKDIQQGEIAIESSREPWVGKAKKLAQTALKRPISELLRRRSEILINYILPSINQGKLKLKTGVTADYVTSNIEYGSETFFAQEGSNSLNREYNYLLFKKGNQIIDGRWISEPDVRPDFIWVPKNNRDALIGRKELSPAVEDLLRLGRHCKKASDVFSFFALIRKVISDQQITPAEKQEIGERYEEVSKVINTESVKNLFKEVKLRGVDVSDLFVQSE